MLISTSSIYFSSFDSISSLPSTLLIYKAMALYIAPVSIYKKPSFSLSNFAIVDFPEPDGPSIAILLYIL